MLLAPAWWEHAPPAADVDVRHVHFGSKHHDAAPLAAVCAAAHRRGVGVVHTCHHLRDPNHATARHDHNLAVCMRHADEVETPSPSIFVQYLSLRSQHEVPRPYRARRGPGATAPPPSSASVFGVGRCGGRSATARSDVVDAAGERGRA